MLATIILHKDTRRSKQLPDQFLYMAARPGNSGKQSGDPVPEQMCEARIKNKVAVNHLPPARSP